MLDDKASALIETIARAIRLYLLKNSQARDTPAGIQRWWIPAGQIYREEDVQSALDYMVRRGWAQKSLVAGTVLYGAVQPESRKERREKGPGVC